MNNEHSDGSVGRGNDIDNSQSCVWETRDNDDARSVASNASSRHSVSAMERRVRMAALVEERKFSAGQAELERYQVELERSRFELQRSQIELQRQRKQLELDKEIAVARAELQVFEEYENASMDENTVRLPSESISHRDRIETTGAPVGHPVTSQQGTATIEIKSGGILPSHQSKHLRHNEKHEQLNPVCHGDPRHSVHVQPAVKCDQGLDSMFGIRHVVDSLNETLKQNQLPRLELTVFGGDSLEFQQWLICFEKLIESNTQEPAQKLQYLMQYTVGDAHTLVSGYSLDMSESGYRAAKQELIKEYGDPYVLSRAYLKRIDSWKTVPPNEWHR